MWHINCIFMSWLARGDERSFCFSCFCEVIFHHVNDSVNILMHGKKTTKTNEENTHHWALLNISDFFGNIQDVRSIAWSQNRKCHTIEMIQFRQSGEMFREHSWEMSSAYSDDNVPVRWWVWTPDMSFPFNDETSCM